MKKKLLGVCFIFISLASQAQQPAVKEPWQKEYRAFATKKNDLVHTKLEAGFDFDKAYLNGKAWLTLHPHFYSMDALTLDAKGMDIHQVGIVKNGKISKLAYTYDSLFLNIKLDKTYTKDEKYTVYIDYTSKPNEYTEGGSSAITEAKGLFFVNPQGKDKEKPTQVWTQGETEHNSVWVPTIDKPDQKTTQEFFLTVPDKFVTLSNGRLVSQTPHPKQHTRTDYWTMELPHAPYLMFFAMGQFSIVKDSYKGKEVNYYVEKAYEPVARQIFGYTPEMMKFFSEKVTGVDFPWVKYDQIVCREFVSGAMENTTSTLHQESAQQNARELTDGNIWESTIAHELFHQWFGDYVTTESWSNITVNESFANYSETLWDEYKHGADEGAYQNYDDMVGYLKSQSEDKNLVRFYYSDKEDVFDAVSYNKGGRILHMLRHIVGDEAFFASLNYYLNANKFGNGNATKLRLAFETVTGKDLNWYWNQWYFNSGHPKVDITHSYNNDTKKETVIIKQLQDSSKLFIIPLDVDIYHGKEKQRVKFVVEKPIDTLFIASSSKPDLVNVDADKVTLWEKTEDKTLEEFIFQYQYAGNLLDRIEAVDYCIQHKNQEPAFKFLLSSLQDPFYRVRNKIIRALEDTALSAGILPEIEKIATTDPKKQCRANAIKVLGKSKSVSYEPLYIKGIFDSSYNVAAASLTALSDIDAPKALSYYPELKKDAKNALVTALEKLDQLSKGDKDFDEVTKKFTSLKTLREKYYALDNYISFLGRITNTENFKKGLDNVVSFRDKVAQYGLKGPINKMILDILPIKEKNATAAVDKKGFDEQSNYIKQVTKD